MSQPELHVGEISVSQPKSVLERVAAGSVALAGASLVAIVVVEAWQVVARYIFNDSPSWTEPVALLLMSTALMLGAAAGVRAQKHFGFMLFVEHVPPTVGRVLYLIQKIIAAAVGLMLTWWGGKMVGDAWDYAMPGAPLPQGAAYLPVCIGGALILVFSLEHLFAPRRPS